MALDGISYLVSALAIAGSGRDAARTAEATPLQAGFVESMGAGLRHVLGDRVLRDLAGSTAIFNFGSGMILAVVVLFATRDVGLDAAEFGLVYGLGNVGFVFGAMLVGVLTHRFGVGRTFAGSSIASAGAMILMAAAGTGSAVVLLFAGRFLGAVSTPVYNVAALSLRQARVSETIMGRVNGTFQFLEWGALPVGSLVGGLLGAALRPAGGARGGGRLRGRQRGLDHHVAGAPADLADGRPAGRATPPRRRRLGARPDLRRRGARPRADWNCPRVAAGAGLRHGRDVEATPRPACPSEATGGRDGDLHHGMVPEGGRAPRSVGAGRHARRSSPDVPRNPPRMVPRGTCSWSRAPFGTNGSWGPVARFRLPSELRKRCRFPMQHRPGHTRRKAGSQSQGSPAPGRQETARPPGQRRKTTQR